LRGRHITLVSDQDELAIVPRGDLAAILRFAAGKEKPDILSEAGFLMPCFRKNRWLRGLAITILEIGRADNS